MRTATLISIPAALVALAGCSAPPGAEALASDTRSPRAVGISAPEAISLLGEPLHAPAMDDQTRRKREQELAEARAAWESDPGSEEAQIWLGRRLAYLSRYNEAIGVYTQGLAEHPESPRLLRHRGHRFITLRRLPEAVADLQAAVGLIGDRPDEVEPDGLPNAQNIPRSTTHTNIYYHLGLAKYLQGDFGAARLAYRRCLEHSANDDMRVAAAYWLYLSLRRIGRDDHAEAVLEPIAGEMDVIENYGYHELLLMFKGLRSPEQVLGGADAVDDATRAYGVAAWNLLNGRQEQAQAMFRRIVAGPMWPAFGHIAAEAELARAEHRHEG